MGALFSCVCKALKDPFSEAAPQTEPEQTDEPREDACGLLPPGGDCEPAAGPHGLLNHGATCFLNSVLQVLFMAPELHEALERPSDLTETDKALRILFSEMKAGTCGTEALMHHLQIKGDRQRDAAEHLELLLNALSPAVSEPFSGQITEKTECSEGHCVQKEVSHFWTQPLPLGHISGRTMTEALHMTLQQTSLSGVYCEECEQKTEALCSCELTRPPQILLLLLKRFDVNSQRQYYKSECEVELSPTLHAQGQQYSLCGVVDHWGNIRGGHYTSTLLSPQDHVWYHFNDETVEKVRTPAGKTSDSAFVLIYRRVQRRAPRGSSKATPDDLDVQLQGNDRRPKTRAGPVVSLRHVGPKKENPAPR